MKKVISSGIIITCIFYGQAFASPRSNVKQGNKFYKQNKFEDAARLYDEALSKAPDSPVMNYDAGTAQYKIGDYPKAAYFFEKSLLTDDKSLETRANYNLGNAKYMLGLSKENADLRQAVQLLGGALNNYKRTMDLDSKDEDAKINYKIVEKKLEELKKKLKQQPQTDNKSSQKENKDKQEQKQSASQEKQEKAKEEQSKKQGQLNQAQQDKSGKEDGQDQAREEKNQEKEENQEQKAAGQVEDLKEMSKEEAGMLLEGYRQEEHAAGMLKDDQKVEEERVLKDW